MADQTPPGNNNKILSQAEVDALLNAVADGSLPTESPSTGPGAAHDRFDFITFRKIVRPQLPGLRIIYDRFMRSFRQEMSKMVRRTVTADIKQTKMIRYSEFMSKLPIPSCLNVFSVEPLIGNGCVSIDTKFVFLLIDALFGGGKVKSNKKVEGRDFTPIELKFIEKLVRTMLLSLENAWKLRYPLKPGFLRTEQNPEYVTITSPDDIVLVTELDLESEGLRGSIFVILPYYSLDPIKHLLTDSTRIDTAQSGANWRNWIAVNLKESKLGVSVSFRGTEITLREVLDLKAGDVIQLNDYMTDPLPVYVEGVHKFEAYMGVSCGFKAIEVDKAIPVGTGGTISQ